MRIKLSDTASMKKTFFFFEPFAERLASVFAKGDIMTYKRVLLLNSTSDSESGCLKLLK
jgi:hypothetical protein